MAVKLLDETCDEWNSLFDSTPAGWAVLMATHGCHFPGPLRVGADGTRAVRGFDERGAGPGNGRSAKDDRAISAHGFETGTWGTDGELAVERMTRIEPKQAWEKPNWTRSQEPFALESQWPRKSTAAGLDRFARITVGSK